MWKIQIKVAIICHFTYQIFLIYQFEDWNMGTLIILNKFANIFVRKFDNICYDLEGHITLLRKPSGTYPSGIILHMNKDFHEDIHYSVVYNSKIF